MAPVQERMPGLTALSPMAHDLTAAAASVGGQMECVEAARGAQCACRASDRHDRADTREGNDDDHHTYGSESRAGSGSKASDRHDRADTPQAQQNNAQRREGRRRCRAWQRQSHTDTPQAQQNKLRRDNNSTRLSNSRYLHREGSTALFWPWCQLLSWPWMDNCHQSTTPYGGAVLGVMSRLPATLRDHAASWDLRWCRRGTTGMLQRPCTCQQASLVSRRSWWWGTRVVSGRRRELPLRRKRAGQRSLHVA